MSRLTYSTDEYKQAKKIVATYETEYLIACNKGVYQKEYAFIWELREDIARKRAVQRKEGWVLWDKLIRNKLKLTFEELKRLYKKPISEQEPERSVANPMPKEQEDGK